MHTGVAVVEGSAGKGGEGKLGQGAVHARDSSVKTPSAASVP